MSQTAVAISNRSFGKKPVSDDPLLVICTDYRKDQRNNLNAAWRFIDAINAQLPMTPEQLYYAGLGVTFTKPTGHGGMMVRVEICSETSALFVDYNIGNGNLEEGPVGGGESCFSNEPPSAVLREVTSKIKQLIK